MYLALYVYAHPREMPNAYTMQSSHSIYSITACQACRQHQQQ
jgi:hypothetical protein